MDSISIKNDEDNQDFLELTVVAEKLQKIEQIEDSRPPPPAAQG